MNRGISRVFLALGLAACVCAGLAAAPDETIGTLTVNGKTIRLRYGVATIEKHPTSPSREYLVLLISDVAIAPADRAPARLLELARGNRIHALRVLWLTDADWVRVVPYDAGIPSSGQQAVEHPTIDLRAFDDQRVEVDVASKMLGQPLQYHALVKAALDKKASRVEIEPEAQELSQPAESTGPVGSDPTSLKRRLGALGYQYNPEFFTNAVKDGNLEAVQLFLKLGTPATTKDSQGFNMVVMTAMMCTREPTEHRTDILKALLAGGADVNAADSNKATALIWAAQTCDAAFVQTLIKAGANVNAKAAGGGTPLMMATVMGREEIVLMLKRAGAKEQ